MEQTQLNYVKKTLLTQGVITRNQCLKVYITRLGALIYKLKQEGWETEGKRLTAKKGEGWGDYVYKLIKAPQGVECETLQHERK